MWNMVGGAWWVGKVFELDKSAQNPLGIDLTITHFHSWHRDIVLEVPVARIWWTKLPFLLLVYRLIRIPAGQDRLERSFGWRRRGYSRR